jgi:hypothetical protein
MLTLFKQYHTKKTKQSVNITGTTEMDQWTPLSQKIFNKLVGVTHHYDLYSDFVATNIWAYMGSNALLNFHGDGVAVRMLEDHTNIPYYTLISKRSTHTLLERILVHESSNEPTVTLKHVPKETIKYLRKSNYIISVEPDRDNHDYVYSVDKFIHFHGRKLRSKKKQLLKVQRLYPHLEVKYGLQSDLNLCEDIEQTKQKNWEVDYEALVRILKQQTVPQLIIALYDGEKMVGFTVNEIISKGYYIGFSGKSDRKYPGLSIALEHETAKIMKNSFGCKYLNLQQDMGIEGLRNYKLSLSPDRLIEKYTVTIAKKQVTT